MSADHTEEARKLPTERETLEALLVHEERVRDAAFDLLSALMMLIDRPVRYHDSRIEIDCLSHSDAIFRMQFARDAIAKARGQS